MKKLIYLVGILLPLIPLFSQFIPPPADICLQYPRFGGNASTKQITGIGDINNDGIDDILKGDSYPRIFFSSINYVEIDIGPYPFPFYRVSAAGDFNGDGIDDFLMANPYKELNNLANVGDAYLIYGNANGFPPIFDINSIDGSNGFRIEGFRENGLFGFDISDVGDFNADGFDDILIGAPGMNANGQYRAGRSYLIFGSSSTYPNGVNIDTISSGGIVFNGIAPGDSSGLTVNGKGDFNGDGFDDVLIRSRSGYPNGNPKAGQFYLVFGSNSLSGNFNLSSLNGNNGFLLEGQLDDRFAFSFDFAGDFNGDGFDDILVAAPGNTTNEMYLIYGTNSSMVNFQVSDINGINGHVFENSFDAGFGHDVSKGGDFNGDGFDDFMISSYAGLFGKVFTCFGTDTITSSNLDLATYLDGNTGFSAININPPFSLAGKGFTFGAAVNPANDYNGDGYDDLIMTAEGWAVFGGYWSAEHYIVYGRPQDLYLGCTDISATNYEAIAHGDNGSCVYPCPSIQNFSSANPSLGYINQADDQIFSSETLTEDKVYRAGSNPVAEFIELSSGFNSNGHYLQVFIWECDSLD